MLQTWTALLTCGRVYVQMEIVKKSLLAVTQHVAMHARCSATHNQASPDVVFADPVDNCEEDASNVQPAVVRPLRLGPASGNAHQQSCAEATSDSHMHGRGES